MSCALGVRPHVSMLFSRREILLAAVSGVASSAILGVPAPAFGEHRLWAAGCLPPEAISSALSGLDAAPASDEMEMAARIPSTDPAAREALARGLKHISKRFQVRPAFFFINGKGAFAGPFAVLPETQGVVLYGTGEFSDNMARDPHGRIVMSIVAHEFGHVLQYKLGHALALRSPRGVKLVELHADFLAGFYMGLRQARLPEMPLEEVFKEFWSIGDRKFDSPGHHGTHEERLHAVARGYRLGRNEPTTPIERAADRGAAIVEEEFGPW